MPDISIPKATCTRADKRHALAPGPDEAFHAFSKAVFVPGALDARTKQLELAAGARVAAFARFVVICWSILALQRKAMHQPNRAARPEG